ncbi:hypothetical protein [Caballeronia sp. INDeC2]|uniref:hypothetical protein n=1 Tax=Caballeronia sp. INDeC2 TaxID=2921747 RepID=UPI002028505D|nr:hypothetical protein [Caballeronia sp. INDeC2]
MLLIAGGIGVTPLKAMAHELDGAGIDYQMHYCAKDASSAAFAEEFEPMRASGRPHFHSMAAIHRRASTSAIC